MDWTIHNYEDFRNLGLVVAAFIAIPLAVWRSFVAHKQAKIAADNHLAETFTRAINQIGSNDTEIRFGGFYALEKIANSNEEYYKEVFEVLCAFLRLRLPYFIEDKNRKSQIPIGEIRDLKLIAQTVITIIGRRKCDLDGRDDLNFEIDLSSTDLEVMIFKEANFENTLFDFTGLKSSVFNNVKLKGASFYGANLERAFLADINLDGINFESAFLNFANLSFANLRGANFENALLEGANLEGANLREAKINIEQIQMAKVYKSTILPNHIDRDLLTFED